MTEYLKVLTGSGKQHVKCIPFPDNHIEQKNCAAQVPATDRMQQHELVGLLYRLHLMVRAVPGRYLGQSTTGLV